LYTSQPKLNYKKLKFKNIDINYENIIKRRKLFGDYYCNHKLYECLKSIFNDKYDLTSFELLIKSRLNNNNNLNDTCINNVNNDKILTIGICGCPNVGKSSLINTLMSRKLVSVSRTPGHTKHYQTLYLTKNIKLCDSPGLVFPLLLGNNNNYNKSLHILSGIYPIAHLKEPYTCIRLISEFIDLINLFKLKHPKLNDFNEFNVNSLNEKWTPIDLCESYALKRGYLTAKANRPDYYRAANELLRMCLDGKFGFTLKPRNFKNEINNKWLIHKDTIELKNKLIEYCYGDYEKSIDQASFEQDFNESSSESEIEEEDNEEEEEEESNIHNPFSVLDNE
jgi:ribosome biogenesis GTPase A